MLYPELFYKVCEIVKPGMFTNPIANVVIEAISKSKTATEINAIIRSMGERPLDYTIHKNKRDLESICLKVKQKYCREFEIKLCEEQAIDLMKDKDVETTLGKIQRKRELFYQEFVEKDQKLKTITEVKDRLIEASQKEGGVTGIESGIDIINEIRGGYQGGDYVLIGARPGQGKTSIAIKESYHLMEQGLNVAFVSLEMPKRQIIKKWASYKSRIGVNRMNAGACGEKLKDVLRTVDNIFELDYEIINTNQLDTILAKIRSLNYKKKLSMVVIDYIQLIRSSVGSSANEKLTYISSELKSLALELDLPIIVLSQLARRVDDQKIQRPNMSHLRDSGALEADADLIFFLFNPSYYGHQYMKWHDGEEYETTNVIEFNCDKNRHGNKKSAKLYFDGNFEYKAKKEIVPF
jgi:replicative DNA helicase